MTTKRHILLDVDGVLADFTRAALRVHEAEHRLQDWPAGERDIPKVIGVSRTQYWKKIDALGMEFWNGLEPYPWLEDLLEAVRSKAPFSILTAASLSPWSAAGKVAWIHRHFPKDRGRRFMDFLIGTPKHLVAGPGRVLIDDGMHNVDRFREWGGEAILFPQVWNRNHAIPDPIGHVRDELERLMP